MSIAFFDNVAPYLQQKKLENQLNYKPDKQTSDAVDVALLRQSPQRHDVKRYPEPAEWDGFALRRNKILDNPPCLSNVTKKPVKPSSHELVLEAEVHSGYTKVKILDRIASEYVGLPLSRVTGENARQEITEFSRKSQKTLQRRVLNMEAEHVRPQVMITLTYGADFEDVAATGKDVKNHLKKFQKRMERFLKTKHIKLTWVWWLEFQKRGAPHIHICWWSPKKLSRRWLDVVREQVARHWVASVNSPNPLIRQQMYAVHSHKSQVQRLRHQDFRYLTVYMSKKEQKLVPDGFADVGRFWGIYGYKSKPPQIIMYKVPFEAIEPLVQEMIHLVAVYSFKFAVKLSGILGALIKRKQGQYGFTLYGKNSSELFLGA